MKKIYIVETRLHGEWEPISQHTTMDKAIKARNDIMYGKDKCLFRIQIKLVKED